MIWHIYGCTLFHKLLGQQKQLFLDVRTYVYSINVQKMYDNLRTVHVLCTIVLFSLRACVEGREMHVQHTYHNGDLYGVRGELHSLVYSAQLQ